MQAWSSRGIYYFFGRTRTGSILQRWCNSPSDCVEAFDHVCLQFLRVESLFWTKMIGQLEGISLEIFFDICSSKLEVSQAFVQRLQLFLKMGAAASMLFISNVFLLKIRCCSLGGDLLFILVHAWQNVWTWNLYDELALRGVTYDRHFCMMKQESWFLSKLYNENFRSDDHSVTHKSWIQYASRRVRPDADEW
jgi:hypothetical protein